MKMQELYKGGLILLLGYIFLKIGGIVFRILCMNTLPVDEYGEVAVFLVLFNWFVLFATLNVTIGLAKFVSQSPRKKDLYYASAIWGTLAMSLVLSAVLLAASPLISQAINVRIPVILWAILCVPFAVIYNVGIFYYRGSYRMKSSTKADGAMMAFRIAALVALLYAGFSYAPYIAFAGSFVLIDLFIIARNKSPLGYGRKEMKNTFKSILLYSAPIFGSEFLRMFSIGLDRIALSAFYTSAEAGIYDVAVSLCLGYMIIANSYSNALLPLASTHHNDGTRRRKALMRALKASSVLFVLYTVLVLLFGEAAITIINPAYLGVFGFIHPLMLAYAVVGFLTILYFFANSVGRQRHALYAGAVFAFLSTALNLYWIPTMMYEGAIYALIVSSLASLAVIGVLTWNSERRS